MGRRTLARILAALWLSLAGGAHAADDPESIVRAFIADYFAWNNQAVASSRAAGDADAAAMTQARADYQKLLDKYCRPGFKGQGIAFGEDVAHTPHESIESVVAAADEATVQTKSVDDLGGFPFTSAYEYRLRRADGRWYLEEVYYVDGNGKFPSL